MAHGNHCLEDEKVRVVWNLVGWSAVCAGVSSSPVFYIHSWISGLALTCLKSVI